MASIVPDGWRELAVTGAAQREIETLAILEAGLPDAYTVYHAVHWTNIERGYAVHGEIDFIVVNLAGDLLAIEQKSVFLEETAEGLVKRYAGKTKPVAVQMARNRDHLLGKLRQRAGNHPVRNNATGKVEITAHNHNFAVDPDSINANEVELTHVDLNDQTLEGLRHKTLPLFSVRSTATGGRSISIIRPP